MTPVFVPIVVGAGLAVFIGSAWVNAVVRALADVALAIRQTPFATMKPWASQDQDALKGGEL